MEYSFISAVSQGCLIDRYGGFTIRYTILKYPRYTCLYGFTYTNNLVGEKENFFLLYWADNLRGNMRG